MFLSIAHKSERMGYVAIRFAFNTPNCVILLSIATIIYFTIHGYSSSQRITQQDIQGTTRARDARLACSFSLARQGKVLDAPQNRKQKDMEIRKNGEGKSLRRAEKGNPLGEAVRHIQVQAFQADA